MSKKVFIDGKAGTTGLRIYERLAERKDIILITLPEEKRKDINARREALNSADIAFLCLPDAAAKESVSLITNPETVVIDTSTAHRTNSDWCYGFPELSNSHKEKLMASKRIAVPGCHASGFIALVYPLIKSGVLNEDSLLSCFSVTGYSGGGKKMIEEYEDSNRNIALSSPRQYGVAQAHKHLPEMCAVTGLKNAPVFSPIVADYYSGMTVTVPLHKSTLETDLSGAKEILKNAYSSGIVQYVEEISEGGFVSANALSGKDSMILSAEGNEDRILLISHYDNLGKGASGAAIECMNIKLGVNPTEGLVL